MDKIKKLSVISVIAGGIMIVPFIVSLILSFFTSPNGGGTVGIIGGADAPIYILMLRTVLESPAVMLPMVFGVVLILYGLAYIAFKDSIRQNCLWKTSALSLTLSAVCSLGTVMLLVWLDTRGVRDYPIEYAFSVGLGWLALAATVVLTAVYVIFRRKYPSFKGILWDCGTFLTFLLPTFFLWFQIYVMVA